MLIVSSEILQKRRVGREAGRKGKYLHNHFFNGLLSALHWRTFTKNEKKYEDPESHLGVVF